MFNPWNRLSFNTLCISILLSAVSSVAIGQTDFNRDIRPILSRHCTVCHGPDESGREADLSLDTFEAATVDLGDYSAIVPRDPDNSEMMLRVTSDDDPMPPDGHERLADKEIELLRKWIAEGATYQTHWSFVKPRSMSKPTIAKLRESDFALQMVDLFVLRKAREHGLEPKSQADPARLIRRLALDLTGLPPSQSMVDRFVANPTNDSYEAIADELLNDPAYGEHWASMWLDLARYADTVGYSSDETRTIWPWRDWLIRSLNENKPFDQLTREMLAGDLLPNATDEQRLATAFHRNTLNNNEGGTNDEEFRTIAVKDRLATTLNTWMGLTVRCAECHSHKYDPISHTEYYQLLDFFNQTADNDQPGEEPKITVDRNRIRFAIDSIDQQIALARKRQADQPDVWQAARPLRFQSRTQSQQTGFEMQPDDSILATGSNPVADIYTLGFKVPVGKYGGLRIELLPTPYHNGRIGRGPDGSVMMTQVVVETADNGKKAGVPLSEAVADYSSENQGPDHLIRDQILEENEPSGWGVLHPGEGFRVPRSAILSFENPLVTTDATEVNIQLVFNSTSNFSNAGCVRISFTHVVDPAEAYEQNNLDPLARRLEQLLRQRNAAVEVPVLVELPNAQRRTTHIMKRGNFQNPGDAVKANVPEAFHDLPKDIARDRLAIANWLLHQNNPLTARVAVNRLWSRLFGQGIVVTEEDFGTQGTPPTHPELLDWLALDFQKHGWDTRRTIRQIVMSATYRQTGIVSQADVLADPANTWLARGPRVRLPAETIRDQALAVSGLLSQKMFGPPVFPPNPVGTVSNAFHGPTWWETSYGEDRHRRAIYTFLKRSQPHPLFETFDTATRDICSLRRIETNTPLQSFMTLNDETFIEAARTLALRMISGSDDANSPPSVEEQIATGLQLALLRPADPERVAVLMKLYQKSLREYEQNPELAVALSRQSSGQSSVDAAPSQAPQLAALTVVANVIFNLDEFLTH